MKHLNFHGHYRIWRSVDILWYSVEIVEHSQIYVEYKLKTWNKIRSFCVKIASYFWENGTKPQGLLYAARCISLIFDASGREWPMGIDGSLIHHQPDTVVLWRHCCIRIASSVYETSTKKHFNCGMMRLYIQQKQINEPDIWRQNLKCTYCQWNL